MEKIWKKTSKNLCDFEYIVYIQNLPSPNCGKQHTDYYHLIPYAIPYLAYGKNGIPKILEPNNYFAELELKLFPNFPVIFDLHKISLRSVNINNQNS